MFGPSITPLSGHGQQEKPQSFSPFLLFSFSPFPFFLPPSLLPLLPPSFPPLSSLFCFPFFFHHPFLTLFFLLSLFSLFPSVPLSLFPSFLFPLFSSFSSPSVVLSLCPPPTPSGLGAPVS